jgi:hypothetical protein
MYENRIVKLLKLFFKKGKRDEGSDRGSEFD